MAKRKQPAAKDEDEKDWRAGLEEARRGKSKADLVHDAGGAEDDADRGPQPEPGPDDIGERMKALQREPEGSEAKERERTRTDPESGETLLPDAAALQQELALERQQRARSAGPPKADPRIATSRAEELEGRLTEQWRLNPAMVGVGRNVPEEPVTLVRAIDLEGEGVDPSKKYTDELGGPGEGAPVAEPSLGEKHHTGAPWPAPLTPSANAPTPSPEPGPEPSQQWHPPQDITFGDHDAAVRGTLGPGAEEQREAAEEMAHARGEPGQENAAVRMKEEAPEEGEAAAERGTPRNSAGKIPHTHLAEKAIEAVFTASAGEFDHGKMQQAFLHAGRMLRASFYRYRDKYKGQPPPPEEAPEPAPPPPE